MEGSTGLNSLPSKIILIGLTVLIIFSPIAVGSVYIVTYSAMELLIFSLLLLHLWTSDFSRLSAKDSSMFTVQRSGSERRSHHSVTVTMPVSNQDVTSGSQIRNPKSEIRNSHYLPRTLLLMLPLFLFLLFCLFQMIPLPFSWIEKISPNTAALYTRLGMYEDSSMFNVPGSRSEERLRRSVTVTKPVSSSEEVTSAVNSKLNAQNSTLPSVSSDSRSPSRPSSLSPLPSPKDGLPSPIAPSAMRSSPVPMLPLTLSLSASSSALLKWLAYAAVFFLAATFVPSTNSRSWINALFVTLFIIGFAEAVYGLYTYLNQSEYLLWFRRTRYNDSVAATYVNRNHFAGLMNMCIPVSLGLFASVIRNRSRARRFTAGIIEALSSNRSLFVYSLFFGLIIMVLALIFSMSRMGQFSLVAAALFVALAFMVSSAVRKTHRFPLLSVAFLLIVGLGLLWGVWKGLGPVERRWQTLEASYEDRMTVWSSTLNLIRKFPAAGTGIGTYELAFPPYKPAKYGAIIYDHAHNDYLEFLSEVGLMGFVPWSVFFLLFFILTLRSWFKRRNTFSRFLGAGGLAATTALLVHSLADFNLQIPANAMLLFLLMGLTWRVVNTSFGHS